uniref:Glycylpeptide N-tetradecanoyltransferase n=1 Tax=Trypanosoma congolense (strain IL3000) TaxID=1068625 RepID=G0UYG5_TRYCI|nr:putative N-myristoyl transferase [Trypanosoma congolense IL3000]
MTTDLKPRDRFWVSQPVLQLEDPDPSTVGLIKEQTIDEVSTEPLPIPPAYEWWTPNVEDPEDLRHIYSLLRDNYVEDRESMFRFNYSQEFLRWALTPPGYRPSWHVAVRLKYDKTTLGFVAGIPITMRLGTPKRILEDRKKNNDDAVVNDYLEPQTICEINFLCVHKRLRSKNFGPTLIREVTRRVNLDNVWRAVYTSGTQITRPFAKGDYFHRNLNPEKLIEVRFSSIPEHYMRFQNPIAALNRVYRLPENTKVRGLRPMRPEDIVQVTQLLRDKLLSFDVAPVFNEEEVGHYLLPCDGVMYSYVVESETNVKAVKGNKNTDKDKNPKSEDKGNEEESSKKRITDFFSYYSLPSTIIGSQKYSVLKVAYIHYYVATKTPLCDLINDLLVIAQREGYDVCNAVNIYDNGSFLKELKFTPGDGNLFYYFYNWLYPTVKPSDVGLIML